MSISSKTQVLDNALVGDLATTPTITPVVAPVETPTEETSHVDTDGGDHDRYAHFCRKDDIMRAMVTGESIVALCGKRWVPTRDPERYPICPTCIERKAAGWTL
ncbi:MAG: DUF3039 domain-containing protein [Acidimicrobiia bacterium]|nr:DUF3039 domain-containing protein [Acidimicrobiia bacterium]